VLAIDTNILVRYLTNDHPDQSPRARAVVEGKAVFVAVTVVLEAEWVLRSAYGYARTDVARALRAFAGLPTVTLEGAAAIAAALDLAEGGMDFAEALHLRKAAACDGMVTFDQKFIRTAHAAGYETVTEP